MAEEVKQLVQTVNQQQQQIASLLDTIKALPGVANPVAVNVLPAPPPTAADVRADKVQRLAVCMRKSNRVKPFRFDSDILMFLKRFQEELVSLKSITGIDFELTKEEYLPIFRASLDFAVLDRLEQRFKRDENNLITWAAVTKDELHKKSSGQSIQMLLKSWVNLVSRVLLSHLISKFKIIFLSGVLLFQR